MARCSTPSCLAEVYLELIGARQAQLGLVENGASGAGARARVTIVHTRTVALVPRLSEDELAAHVAFLATLGEGAIWREYQPG